MKTIRKVRSPREILAIQAVLAASVLRTDAEKLANIALTMSKTPVFGEALHYNARLATFDLLRWLLGHDDAVTNYDELVKEVESTPKAKFEVDLLEKEYQLPETIDPNDDDSLTDARRDAINNLLDLYPDGTEIRIISEEDAVAEARRDTAQANGHCHKPCLYAGS